MPTRRLILTGRTFGSPAGAGIWAAAGLALLLFSPTLAAGAEGLPVKADSPLPKAEEILDRLVVAEGGKGAYDALQTRILYGTMKISGIGMNAPLTEYEARPNKSYMLINSASMGKIESGTDGVVAWESSSISGPKIKEGAEKASALREARFDGMVDWRSLYSKAECLGVDSVNNQVCYKVMLVPAEGSPDTCFFSRETGLLLLERSSVDTEMGKVPVAAYAEDYRKVDGVLLPFKMRQVVMGGVQEMTVVVDSVRHNSVLPPDRFALPAEVKALLDKAKADSVKSGGTGK